MCLATAKGMQSTTRDEMFMLHDSCGANRYELCTQNKLPLARKIIPIEVT
jgi:hypothetical protein